MSNNTITYTYADEIDRRAANKRLAPKDRTKCPKGSMHMLALTGAELALLAGVTKAPKVTEPKAPKAAKAPKVQAKSTPKVHPNKGRVLLGTEADKAIRQAVYAEGLRGAAYHAECAKRGAVTRKTAV